MDSQRPGERHVPRDAEEASKGVRYWRIAVIIVLGLTVAWCIYVLLSTEWAAG